jgi:hypothetical protein
LANRVIHIGQTFDIPLIVLDQNTNPIAGFDFAANPPSCVSSNPSALGASIVAPNTLRVVGQANSGGDVNVTVTIPTVAHQGVAVIGVDAIFVPTPTDIRFNFSGTPTP